MKAKASWLWLSLAVVVAMLLMLVPGLIGAQQPTAPVSGGPADQPRPQQRPPGPILAKLHPDLRALAQAAGPALPTELGLQAPRPEEPIFIEVVASVGPEKPGKKADFDLSPYFVDGKVMARPPLGKGEAKMQIFIGRVYPSSLLKIAWLGQVQAILPIVLERNGEPFPYPPDEERQFPKKGPEDWARLRAKAEKLRAGSLPWDQANAFGDGRSRFRALDWFEVTPEGPHKAQAAWDRGYRGEGVTVAVLDDGIDAAHPDLMGTQKIYSSTVVSQYNGWPMVFSPFSMLLYVNDNFFGTTDVADGFPGIHYVDTSTTPTLATADPGTSTFAYTPLIDYGVPGTEHTYVISDTMTQSGVVHVGTHPDNDLRDFVWGEKVAVLVTDPNAAGVYDTVYVDLDNDYDFRDEKPLTRADPTDPGTYNDMVAYRDMDGDGLADISGGMVYFIADGSTPIPASDWQWGPALAPPPTNGDLVAFSGGTFDRPYSHGTQCASNVVAQGVVNGMLPAFRDLPGDGKPAGAVFGMAPEAKMVNVSDIYWNFDSSKIDAYIFAAVGYDGIDQTGFDTLTGTIGHTDTDAIQITSNSYGSSDQDNDGWDYDGQVVSQLQRWWAPYLQFLFSTGNGAPAYGTVAPPSPATGIGVGASTEFGSTGWDSITDTMQIMNNDVTPFSNRGPGARGTNGVDVVAGGAFAAGDEELNYYSISAWGVLDGNLSWDSWGGTSRSAPVAMGVLALIDQAFYAANGRWPAYDEAQALLMSTATDLNFDTFTQGAGSVNADRGTAVAGGHYGLYVEGSEPAWQPGDYRGVDYPGFAHIAYPGDIFTKTFTLHNDGATGITAGISDTTLRRISSVEFDFTVTPDMVAAESAYGDENRDNFFKAFNYFIPITATGGMDASWYNIAIPPDADLMIVRQMFPFDQFDADGDYSWDNRFYLVVYNWQDEDGDGLVWDDKDSNNVVNFINSGVVSQVDGAQELVWGDPRTEIDRWEFGRFSYHRPGGNRNEMWVHDPLDRMIDGLFIGLRHHPGSIYTGTTTLSHRIDFYSKEDVPWLTSNTGSLLVPAGGTATFLGTVNVPAGMEPGSYEAAIEIQDPGLGPDLGALVDLVDLGEGYNPHTSVIPVVLSVAADFSDGLQLGGAAASDEDAPYNNGAVRGLFDWTWRAESGDWRFFFMDVDTIASILFEEDFEGTFPPTGWTVYDNAGTGNVWDRNDALGGSNRTNGSGYSAAADSDAVCNGLGWDTELWSLPIALTVSTPVLTYESNFQDYAGAGDAWLDISIDGGTTWTNLTYWTGDWGPTSEMVDISAYAGQTVILRWRYSDNDDGCAWYWHIDDVRIVDSTYPPDTQILVKDEWDDAAPHTDIDTIVLGPTSTSLGSGWYDFSEPDYYGPYVLDTVGASPNTYMGSGKWRFDTSSGANEDWVTVPLQDGLHELLQHNVLFEGDKFHVVFTKTLGTLQEDVHAFDIETEVDQGEVGQVTLQASLPLNGLVAEGFGLGGPEYFLDEPIDFVDNNTIEWTHDFMVTHGAKIELWTSSTTIPDIDLYLFYCGPTGDDPCEQRAASTTGTSDEYVQVLMPEDGVWLVGINNWSGPAGTFDLTKLVVQGNDLSVSGLPTGTIPANTPVSFTVTFSRTMTVGETYEGLLFAGPLEAPALKQIPIVITRLPSLVITGQIVDSAGNRINCDDVESIDLLESDTEQVTCTLGDNTYTIEDECDPGATRTIKVCAWVNGELRCSVEVATTDVCPSGWGAPLNVPITIATTGFLLDLGGTVEACGGGGLDNVQVSILDGDGAVVATATTNANGEYVFQVNGFIPGFYTIEADDLNDVLGPRTFTFVDPYTEQETDLVYLSDHDGDGDIDGDDLDAYYHPDPNIVFDSIDFAGENCLKERELEVSGTVLQCVDIDRDDDDPDLTTDGGPVEEAAVFLLDTVGNVIGLTVTDANGEYEFDIAATDIISPPLEGGVGLPGGDYTVTVIKAGYQIKTETFDPGENDGKVEEEVNFDDEGTGTLDETCLSRVFVTVEGIVEDCANGQLVDEATVTVYDPDEDEDVATDETDDGEYDFEFLPILGDDLDEGDETRDYEVQVEKDGYFDQEAIATYVLGFEDVPFIIDFTDGLCFAPEPASIWPGRRIQLPVLDTTNCQTWLQVQNVGEDDTKAVLVIWGDPGSCEPQASGPFKAECTGLIHAGSAWTWKGALLPSGAKSAIIYSLGVDETGSDIVADVVCEFIAETVLGDDDDWRRFDRQFRLGGSGSWTGGSWTFPDDLGQPLAVTVNRDCPGDNTPSASVNAAYTGISDPMEGIYDPVSGGYMYYTPLVWASFGIPPSDWNSVLHIQNSGDECTSIEIWFQAQEQCLRATIGEVLALAPGESWQFDPNTVVGPFFQGSAWLRASQPLGVVVDQVGQDMFMSYRGFPADNAREDDPQFPGGDLFTVGSLVNYAPLTYREYNGWDTGIQVQNLSSVVNAKVKVYFFDASGDIVTTIVDWICPRGSQTFFLPAIAWPGFAFEYVGAARIESQAWWSPGDPGIDAPNVMSVVNLVKYQDATYARALEALAYNAYSEPEVFDWQHGDNWWEGFPVIAIPFVAQDKQGVTSEIAIQNVVPWPGFVDFAVELYDQNGQIDTICEKLNEKQAEYIDLSQWQVVQPGFLGSVIIRPTDWHYVEGRALPYLAAVGVERVGRVLSDPDIPGDESKGFEGFPIAWWWERPITSCLPD